MANSQYEYVRNFELSDTLLPDTWIVIRIDGRGFHKLSAKYQFEKPNDRRALGLMNDSAISVLKNLPDIFIAYGQSDEFSFVFHKSCALFERRASKLVTTVVSTFTANYVHKWPKYFPDTPLDDLLPSFDGRAILYPSVQNLKDYLSWRQVDCHINNLYNTTFWAMIQRGGIDAAEAENQLKGTFSSDKNEILFSRYQINYNNEDLIFKKGSVIFRDYNLDQGVTTTITTAQELESSDRPVTLSKTQQEKVRKARQKATIVTKHIDVIKEEFWNERPWLLSNEILKVSTKGVKP
ncbi:MAG: tRNA-His guanylyltransferase [Cirrosporium novae-zelandiae]|nr:MAG: tRNA-His guanylyltransferase [Cirrosporium novae-zelandiae]